MTDLIECARGAKPKGMLADREWGESVEHRHAPKVPNPWPDYSERRTATASWQRSVLIIATLSALSWAAVILFVIAALSAL